MPEDHGFRENIGIAVDGGGIKGAIVAHGLIELENILGVERLLDAPQLKVVAGTSTGALIASSIAAGLSGTEILEMYRAFGEAAFAQPGPMRPFGNYVPFLSNREYSAKCQRRLEKFPGIGDLLVYALFPARYSFKPLRKVLRDTLTTHPMPNNDPTLAEVGEHLRATSHGPTLIITATEVTQRRTHFFKTTADEQYGNMKLADAMLASSCIPTYFPPIPLPVAEEDGKRLLVDGGVGEFGNPAFVVAWELCDLRNSDTSRHYDPEKTTVISLGTGTLAPAAAQRVFGGADNWWALKWVPRSLDIFTDSAIRQQSRNVISGYPNIDLRRYQVSQKQTISADNVHLIDTVLKDLGLEMRELIRQNRHALHPDPDLRHNPEGI